MPTALPSKTASEPAPDAILALNNIEVVSLGLKSIVSGTLTTCLLGAIVGVLS